MWSTGNIKIYIHHTSYIIHHTYLIRLKDNGNSCLFINRIRPIYLDHGDGHTVNCPPLGQPTGGSLCLGNSGIFFCFIARMRSGLIMASLELYSRIEAGRESLSSDWGPENP